MQSQHVNDQAVASDSSSLGLENRVRNLILSNTTGTRSPHDAEPKPPTARHSLPPGISASATISQPGRPSQPDGPSSNGINGDVLPQHVPQGPRGGRRRPNQAQRRQMNSQYTIPIDLRAQQSPTQPYQSPNSHYSRPSQAYQRHNHSNSVPRAMHHEPRANHSFGSNPWNGPSHQGPPPPGFPSHQSHGSYDQRRGGFGQLYNPRRPHTITPENIAAQAALLDQLCSQVVPKTEIELPEIKEKEDFRCRIEAISREAITKYELESNPSVYFDPFSVELRCFGSLSSGFATKASDMDLGLLSPMSPIPPDAAGSAIPRLLEKMFLDAGLGARLLTRTRVPIIKLCQSPPEKLYKDLLDERFRWENGIEEEDHGDDEDGDQEHNGTHDDNDDNHGRPSSAENGSPLATDFSEATERTQEKDTIRLRQGPNNSILSYFNMAKRVLRRAGGRDVTMPNYRTFTDQDWDILNRVCEAFIVGLADQEIRQHLIQQLPSASSLEPRRSSLRGVFIQAEGEELIRLWFKREFDERKQTQKDFMEQSINMWRELEALGFGMDPVYHAKQLQAVLERLQKVPSIQFATLEQGQNETPFQYFTRAQEAIGNLQPLSGDSSSRWREATVKQYIAGISPERIRHAVQEWASSLGVPLPLQTVSRRHASLHLARELERAVEKNLYEQSQIADVNAYINLLRSPLQQSKVLEGDDAFVIPLDAESSALVDRIRMIRDPHTMAPNQPKDRYQDRLEYPKTGVGVQCDINFSAQLGLQNSLLLRCYSHTDPRVRPMVLFVKHWAKTRGINSGYRGTLSSYGYVLMVLHYLVNVAQPFVSPNLQQLAPQPPPYMAPEMIESTITCRGYNIQFWRNEQEILELARANQLNHNTESIGHLLRGFFEYYAHSGQMVSGAQGRGFEWGRDVLSLRTPGGLLTKQIKGWTGAKTVLEPQGSRAAPLPPPQTGSIPSGFDVSSRAENAKSAPPPSSKSGEVKEIRHRYLFAIEDPFEIDHNVARTVTHNGIVSIRDEFRRAWRIIKAAGSGLSQEDLLRDVNEEEDQFGPFSQLLDSIHGIQSAKSK